MGGSGGGARFVESDGARFAVRRERRLGHPVTTYGLPWALAQLPEDGAYRALYLAASSATMSSSSCWYSAGTVPSWQRKALATA